DRDCFVRFTKLDPGPAEAALHERCLTGLKTAKDIVEQAVHLAVQGHERVIARARRGDLLISRPGNKITDCHGSLLPRAGEGTRTCRTARRVPSNLDRASGCFLLLDLR